MIHTKSLVTIKKVLLCTLMGALLHQKGLPVHRREKPAVAIQQKVTIPEHAKLTLLESTHNAAIVTTQVRQKNSDVVRPSASEVQHRQRIIRDIDDIIIEDQSEDASHNRVRPEPMGALLQRPAAPKQPVPAQRPRMEISPRISAEQVYAPSRPNMRDAEEIVAEREEEVVSSSRERQEPLGSTLQRPKVQNAPTTYQRPKLETVGRPSNDTVYHPARPTERSIAEKVSRRPRPNYPGPSTNYYQNSPRPTNQSSTVSSATNESNSNNSTSNSNASSPRPTVPFIRPLSFFVRPSWFLNGNASNAQSNTSSNETVTPEPTPIPKPEPKKIWALWNHANGDNSLAEFIDFNAHNMARARINDSLLVFIQADRPYDYGTYRYRIQHDDVTLAEHLSYEMGQQPGQEVIDGFTWMQDNYEFTNLILNLWGHGSGIEDPDLRKLRGILFDDTNETYLNNQEMSRVVDTIARKLNKNIDILGTDACLMGAIEIGWQVRNSVDILVASETTEPGYGWDYEPFLNKIATTKNISAADAASAIVEAYGNYYKKTLYAYTLSAVELKQLQNVVDHLHDVISKIKLCMQKDARAILVALMSARALSLQMDDNSYIDLADFLDRLADQLGRVKVRAFSEDSTTEIIIHNELNNELDIVIDDSRNVISDVISYFTDSAETKAFKDNINRLRESAENAIKAVKKAVICNTAGNTMGRAKGMTIYFPPIHSPIHKSYPLTKFAMETRWMNDFLINIMGYQVG